GLLQRQNECRHLRRGEAAFDSPIGGLLEELLYVRPFVGIEVDTSFQISLSQGHREGLENGARLLSDLGLSHQIAPKHALCRLFCDPFVQHAVEASAKQLFQNDRRVRHTVPSLCVTFAGRGTAGPAGSSSRRLLNGEAGSRFAGEDVWLEIIDRRRLGRRYHGRTAADRRRAISAANGQIASSSR